MKNRPNIEGTWSLLPREFRPHLKARVGGPWPASKPEYPLESSHPHGFIMKSKASPITMKVSYAAGYARKANVMICRFTCPRPTSAKKIIYT